MKNNYTFVYMSHEVERVLINVPKDLKKEFCKTCKELNVTMTQVLVASMDKFIKTAKKQIK